MKTPKSATIFLLVGVGFAGMAKMVNADFTIAPGTLKSTRPCVFAEQLRDSAAIRTQYTNKLIAALNGTLPEVNTKGGGSKQSNRTQGIDALSADCLGCHDGVATLQITVVLRNDPFRTHSRSDFTMTGMDHPIGMDYNRYVSASRAYKPLSSIGNKMILVGGKVGCITCHDPLNPGKGHLVMSDVHSALCLTCHNLGSP